MRTALLVVLIFLTVAAAFGQEPPATAVINAPPAFLPMDARTIVDAPSLVSATALRFLASKSDAEKGNMILDVFAGGAETDQVAARRGAALWNQGDFDRAISVLGSIAQVPLTFGVAYRSPVAAQISGATAADIRIGTRDSVYKVTMAYDPLSKNLFCAFLYRGDGYLNGLSCNISTDGGSTWRESYATFGGYVVNDIGLTLVDKYFVLAVPYLTNSVLWVQRFMRTTGNALLDGSFAKYQHLYDAVGGLTYTEVSCCSNKDFANNYAFVTAIRSDHRVTLAIVTDTSASDVYNIASNATTARRGISIAFNQGTGPILFVSYIDTLEKACVDTLGNTILGGGTLGRRTRFSSVLPAFNGTSIGAWKDTILVAYTAIWNDVVRAFYEISYNGGGSFAYGFIGDTLQTSELPVVAMDRGRGLAAVYRYYTPTRELRFTNRTYKFAPWSTPVLASGIEPFYIPAAIAYTDSGKYAVVNTSWTSPVPYGAFFATVNVTPVTGVAYDAPHAPGSFALSQNYPNPFNPSTTIGFALPWKSNVRLTVFNSLGQQVAQLVDGEMAAGYHRVQFNASGLASGVYFYRMQVRAFDAASSRDSKAGSLSYVETKKLLLMR